MVGPSVQATGPEQTAGPSRPAVGVAPVFTGQPGLRNVLRSARASDQSLKKTPRSSVMPFALSPASSNRLSLHKGTLTGRAADNHTHRGRGEPDALVVRSPTSRGSAPR